MLVSAELKKPTLHPALLFIKHVCCLSIHHNLGSHTSAKIPETLNYQSIFLYPFLEKISPISLKVFELYLSSFMVSRFCYIAHQDTMKYSTTRIAINSVHRKEIFFFLSCSHTEKSHLPLFPRSLHWVACLIN